jgi:hypothetical protein
MEHKYSHLWIGKKFQDKQKKEKNMFNDKILKSVAEAVKQVLATEKLHPNQQKLDVHEPEKDKLTSKDFEMLRKGKKADVKEANNPFDVKNYKSQLPTKPGEKAGFDSKKISTGTVYTRKPVKDEKPLKEEDAYDKDRYAVKDGKAVKDNPGHMGSANYKDQPHHVYASSAEEALKKKSVKEGASQEDYLKEIEMAKKRAQGQGNPDLTKGKVTAVKQESVEKIDELSKDTLKSYSSKAKKDSEEYKKAGYAYDSDPDERAFAPKAFKKAASRAAGAAKADSKIKEEVVVEGSGPKEKQKTPYRDINSPEYRAAAEKQKQKMKDTTAAEPGKKMLYKMNKEEVEQIDELKKSTLASYVKKASHDVAAKGAATRQFANDSEAARKGEDYSEARKKMKMADKTFAKSWKRREGMAKAVDKLAKEEVEQIDELSVNKMLKYSDAAEKDRKKLNAKWDAGTASRKEQEKAIGREEGENRATNKIKKKTGKYPWQLNREETEHIEERSMTEPEMKKREKIVKSMKKGMQGFKDRYGDRAKDVMYATATKQAMKD